MAGVSSIDPASDDADNYDTNNAEGRGVCVFYLLKNKCKNRYSPARIFRQGVSYSLERLFYRRAYAATM